MAEQKQILTKKDAKAFLVSRNSVIQREDMTPEERARFMCDHLHENGQPALKAFKGSNGEVVPGKYICTYCNEIFSLEPVHQTELAKATQTVLDVIQQVKIISPISDNTAGGIAGVMFFLKNLSAMYRNATKDANTTNKAFNYMSGKRGSNMSNFYDKYSGGRSSRAPK